MTSIRQVILPLLSATLFGLCGPAVAADGHGAHTNATAAPATPFERKQALDTSQSAIGKTVGDYRFFDTDGNTVRLSAYRGKPLVISMIYTSCFHICPTTTKHLHQVIKKARAVLGEDSFNVVTVGFDSANDTADAMRHYARQQGVRESNWDFLATDGDTVKELAEDLGFLFYPSPNGFDHLVQSSVLDSRLMVNRQVYGIQFDTPHLVEPLKAMVFGVTPQLSLFEEISSRIKLFCTVYDPASDSYRFDYSIFVGLFIGLSLGGFMLALLIREWRYRHRRGERG